jgi:exodeoxyribonuclease VII large subunit
VRAIASSPIPIITGIGHEIDFTLSDFAADKRGATPSQAAEIAVPEIKVLTDKISTMTERCTNAISQKIEILAMELQKISAHRLLQKPQNYLNELHQRLDDQEDRIQRGAKGFLENYYLRLQKYDNLSQMLKNTKLFWETKYVRLVEKLEGLSPLKAISRGYSYVTNRDGKIVTEKKQVTIGDSLEVRIIDAILDCKVVSIKDLQVKG